MSTVDFTTLNVLIREGDEREAIAWRVQTLRQLNPPSFQDPNTELDGMYDRTAIGRTITAEKLARSYLQGVIRPFIKDAEQEDAILSLTRIVLQSADLSLSLWTHKLCLVSKYLHDGDIGDRFAHDNEMVEAHQLQNKYLDMNPGYFDGAKILMITHPALIRYGEEGASDPGSRTVLKKAICWMAPPSESLR